MKLIHCADLHLDSKMTANLSKEKAKIRKNELLYTFKRMVGYAAENDIDGIIIAGDLYDTKNISKTAKNAVIESIVNHPDIDFYYLKGNHDGDSLLSQFSEIPSNLKLFYNKWTYYEIPDSDIVIAGIEIDENNSTNMYDTLSLNPNKFNIVVLHGQETVHKSKEKNINISLKELRNKNIDYLALGHIHEHKEERLDNRGIYCYSGCLEGRGFDECGEHGFVVLDIDRKEKEFKRSFINIASRILHHVQIDISECVTTSDISEKIENRLSELKIDEKNMIKVSLIGSVDIECDKNIDLIAKQFENEYDYFFFKIKDESCFKVDYGRFALDESLKGEFVRTVMADEKISNEDKATIIRYGIQSLAGEELE